MQYRVKLFVLSLLVSCAAATPASDSEHMVRVGVFEVDVSPTVGSPVAYVPAREIVDPLSARGIVIQGDGLPVVLCAVDFIGIGNECQDVWRKALARATGTTPDRVSIHALHQHDGCRCDFTIERILEEHGLGGTRFDNPFLRDAIDRTAAAAGEAADTAQPVTHVGFGEGKVEKVASNRRVLGEDGKVKIVRFSATKNPEAIAAPEGTIDPWLKSVSFWNGDSPVAVLTYYATHPQSHYGKGDVTCEFVGLARNARETATGVPHIHFDGAGGNIAAGKYNDGSPENRPVLAARMEAGMAAAWENTKRHALAVGDLEWRTRYVQLPVAEHIDEEALQVTLGSADASAKDKFSAAAKLAWLQRTKAAIGLDVSALRLGNLWLLNLPGELFVEYQLAAQALRPQDAVCVAAYEDYGPGYIGTEIAYSQGGYETGENASLVSPAVEEVLMGAIRAILE